MIICTYYDDIRFNEQDRLLEIWKTSWENQGFTALVLNLDQAIQCSYYIDFFNNMDDLYIKITKESLKKYGRTCYLRWLAYASLRAEEPFLVSDYDVINCNFSVNEAKTLITSKLTFLDRYCPCLAIGTSEQYLNFTKQIIEFSKEFVELLTDCYQRHKLQTFHDQDFLWSIHKIQPYFNSYNTNQQLRTPLDVAIPKESKVCLYDIKNEQKRKQLYHISNDSIIQLKLTDSNLNLISNGAIKQNIAKNLLTNNTINKQPNNNF